MRLNVGVTKPRKPVFGFDVAGRVEAVGEAVTSFQPGDRVVASRGLELGCHAELVTVDEQGAIAKIPEDLSYQDAVSPSFGGVTALDFLRLGKLISGEMVLINGASGAVGTMAVQLAKHTGAEVTAVCSGANADLVKGLGADHVIDYTVEDFTRDGRRYDVIMDNHGNAPYARVKLAERGELKPVIDSVLPFADRRGASPGRQRPQGRKRRAHVRRHALTSGSTPAALPPDPEVVRSCSWSAQPA